MLAALAFWLQMQHQRGPLKRKLTNSKQKAYNDGLYAQSRLAEFYYCHPIIGKYYISNSGQVMFSDESCLSSNSNSGNQIFEKEGKRNSLMSPGCPEKLSLPPRSYRRFLCTMAKFFISIIGTVAPRVVLYRNSPDSHPSFLWCS